MCVCLNLLITSFYVYPSIGGDLFPKAAFISSRTASNTSLFLITHFRVGKLYILNCRKNSFLVYYLRVSYCSHPQVACHLSFFFVHYSRIYSAGIYSSNHER